MTISWDRPIQTRDGRKAVLLEVVGDFHYVAVEKGGACGWDARRYVRHGRNLDNDTTPDDIINAPETVSRWANVFPWKDGVLWRFYSSRAAADEIAGSIDSRLAVVRIDICGDKVSVEVEDV